MTESLQILVEYIEKNAQVMQATQKHLQGIGQQVKDLDKNSAKMSTTFKQSWTEVNAALAVVQRGLQAVKKGYDFAKEGAQIDFTRGKFDRLTESIGTTADALLNDLKVATRGIYSDMELMASATDFVALGLAKDHEEAVRLSRVAAGLNMNMNQLVLTLTNMTTMRFDAIGVNVDGFKEKVKGLEEAGLDANTAFKEAFLQQAESQLKRVGEAADSPIGAFMQLEAAVKDLGDSMKVTAAEGLLPFVKGLNESIAVAEREKQLIEQGIPPHLAYRMALNDIVSPLEKVNAATESWDQALLNHKNIIIDIAEEQVDFAAGMKELRDLIGPGLSDAQDTYNEKLAEYNAQLEEAKDLEEREGILKKIQDETEAYKEKAAAISFSIAQQQVEAAIAAGGVDEGQALAFLNDLAKSYGMIDEKSHAATESQIRLISLATEGKISWESAAQAIATNNSMLAGIPLVSTPAMDSIYGVSDSARDLTQKLTGQNEKLEGAYNKIRALDGLQATATVNIVVNGSVPGIGGGGGVTHESNLVSGGPLAGGFASGGTIGGAGAGSMFTVGEQGWEMGIVNKDGSITIIPHKTSKELVKLGVMGAGLPGFAFGGDIVTPGQLSSVSGNSPNRRPGPSLVTSTGGVRQGDGTMQLTPATSESSVPSVPVTALTNIVTGEVERLGGAVTQSTLANVNATERQTQVQERSNQEVVAALNGVRDDLRNYNTNLRDSLRSTLQEIL